MPTKSEGNETGGLSLLRRIDLLLADAEAGGALSLEAARQAASLAASNHPQRYRRALRLAAGLSPMDASSRLALARRMAEDGEIEAAKAEADAILKDAVDQGARAQAAYVLGEIARAHGEPSEARRYFSAVVAIERDLLNADPTDGPGALWYARATGRVAELDAAAGDLAKGFTGAEGALAMLKALALQDRETPLLAADIADAEMRMGALALSVGDAIAASAHFNEATGRYEALILIEPDEPHWRAVLADCWALAAEAAFTRQAPQAAREAIDKALQLRVKLAVQDRTERWSLAATWRLRAAVLAAIGDVQAAAESLNQARALAETMCGEAPDTPDPVRFLVHTLLEQADLALSAGMLEPARGAAAEARRFAEPFARKPDATAAWRSDLAAAWEKLGDVARSAGVTAQAQDAYARCVELRRLARDGDREGLYAARALATSLIKLGDGALDADEINSARIAFDESVGLRLALVEAYPEAPSPARDLAVALERVGLAAAASGDFRRARDAWQQERAIAARIFPDDSDPDGLRFMAIVEAHLASLGGEQADMHRAAALKRLDLLAQDGRLSQNDDQLRRRLWEGH